MVLWFAAGFWLELLLIASDIYSSNNEKMIAGMEILLEHGANPNILSGQGDTPMHFLAKVPSNSYISGILQQAFDLFFKHGADINIANNDNL